MGKLYRRVVSRRECPMSSATTTRSVLPRTRLVANVCLRTWAVGSSSSAAGFGYRDQHHLPLARLEVELHLARDRGGDALAVAGQALDGFAS